MESSITRPNISASDRLSMTLFIAIAFHAILILGISFTQTLQQPDSFEQTMDIVLVQTKSVSEPKDAEYIAQHNQEASGSSDTADIPSNPLSGPIPTPSDGEAITPQETQPSEAKQTQSQQFLIADSAKDKVLADSDTQKERPTLEQQKVEKQSQQSTIAQLSSEIKMAEKKYAERPIIHFIDAVSAKSAVEAKYTNDWIQRVESIGNLNYPEDARKDRITGKLVLNVLLNNTGEVLDVRIAISSGNKVLDEAAKQIVTISSPFPKFPAEMKQEYDQLMITRTWSFKTED
jgi:protein TonB